MAQHDYSIANQTASSARTDINNALAAIVSNNSGSEPSVKYANMWWYDTSANLLKIRNEANTAWITIGELNQTLNTFSGGTPAGAITAFAMSTAPSGWLKCNGQAVSRTTYAALFSAIGTTYGSGDGTTTFTLPDLRGEFIRGWDDSRGVDSGRTMGSTQADELESHDHGFTNFLAPDGVGGSRWAFTNNDNQGTSALRTDATGGTETRPRNVALNYCIKY